MKIYIAGKITGDPDYKAKFNRVRELIEAEGFTVLHSTGLPLGLSPADYMRVCFAMMDSADVVVFLPDWRESRGVGWNMSGASMSGSRRCIWSK